MIFCSYQFIPQHFGMLDYHRFNRQARSLAYEIKLICQWWLEFGYKTTERVCFYLKLECRTFTYNGPTVSCTGLGPKGSLRSDPLFKITVNISCYKVNQTTINHMVTWCIYCHVTITTNNATAVQTMQPCHLQLYSEADKNIACGLVCFLTSTSLCLITSRLLNLSRALSSRPRAWS